MNSVWAKQKAFTIVELLIVIVVIAILAAITIVAYNGIQDRARTAAIQSDLSQAHRALELAKAEAADESYPSSLPASLASQSGYSYQKNPGGGYCLVRTVNGVSYFITADYSSPVVGSCAGLISWWPLNGNARDASGYGNSGTVNGASPTTGQSGGSATGYSFDGNDFIGTPNPGFTGTSAGTVSVWFKTSDATTGGQRSVVAWGHPSVIAQRIQLGVEAGELWERSVGGEIASAGGGYNDGQWHLFTITKPAGSTISGLRFYIDGQYISATYSGNTTPLNISSSNSVKLGMDAAGGSYFTGSLDDVRIYSRQLSDNEVSDLYVQGAL